jgi:hypothetical protein
MASTEQQKRQAYATSVLAIATVLLAARAMSGMPVGPDSVEGAVEVADSLISKIADRYGVDPAIF